MIPAEPELIPSKDAATRLGLSEASLANWRSQHRGPRYLKVGRSVYYRLEDLRAWIDSCLIDPCAQRVGLAERKAGVR